MPLVGAQQQGGLPMLGGSVSIQDIIRQLQKSQESANLANIKRYEQGLGTITAGTEAARGLYGEAAALSGQIGAGARADVETGAGQLQARTEQQLTSRGLGGTTILGSMTRGVEAERQRGLRGVEEAQAGRMMGLKERQAGMETGQAGQKAGFIERRTDRGPDVGMYSSLMKQAAQQKPAFRPYRMTTFKGRTTKSYL